MCCRRRFHSFPCNFCSPSRLVLFCEFFFLPSPICGIRALLPKAFFLLLLLIRQFVTSSRSCLYFNTRICARHHTNLRRLLSYSFLLSGPTLLSYTHGNRRRTPRKRKQQQRRRRRRRGGSYFKCNSASFASVFFPLSSYYHYYYYYHYYLLFIVCLSAHRRSGSLIRLCRHLVLYYCPPYLFSFLFHLSSIRKVLFSTPSRATNLPLYPIPIYLRLCVCVDEQPRLLSFSASDRGAD